MNEERNLSTADFAAAADRHEQGTIAESGQARDLAPGDLHATARDIRDTREEGLRAPPAERVMPEPREEKQHAEAHAAGEAHGEQLAPLFLPQMAQNFRSKWDEVQIGFVDDPVNAVKRADELVAQVMKNLAQTFADERAHLEGQMNEGDTEHMRVALRRYRSFFQRLLSL